MKITSSYREVRVGEGSRYLESTVLEFDNIQPWSVALRLVAPRSCLYKLKGRITKLRAFHATSEFQNFVGFRHDTLTHIMVPAMT